MREMPKRCVFDFCSPPRGESVGGAMKLLAVLLLVEAAICGGVFTFRYVSNAADAVSWQHAYWAEKGWHDYYQRRLEMFTTRRPKWDKDPTTVKGK